MPVVDCNRKSKIINRRFRNRRFSREDGGFFIGMPSRKGHKSKENANAILRMGGTKMMRLRKLCCLVSILLTAGAVKAATVTFDDLTLPAESYWNGSDGSGGFSSGGAHFSNNYNAEWASWDGFSYSNLTDSAAEGIDAQYNAVAGSGQGGSANYAVGYIGFVTPPTITLPEPGFVQSLYVTNSNYTYYSMLNGDAFAKKFGGDSGNDPDFYKLTITGRDVDGNTTGTVDFYLADYRFEDNAEDYIVDTWRYVDLTSLGKVMSLEFTLSSSDVGDFGMNTPGYFAIDTITYGPAASLAGPYTEAGISGYIDPGNNWQHAEPQNPNAILNPIFRGWATQVVSYQPAPGVDAQWADPNKALGPATGDRLDVVSLGDLSRQQIDDGLPPGQITLFFDEPIRQGRGYDFVVFENGFTSDANWATGSVAGQTFAELGYVEVSSNGVDFVRFPAVSLTPEATGPYGTIEISNVYNLAGKHPNGTGTPFDLLEIVNDPMVVSGLVDVNDIRYVRIVDIPGSGDFYDEATANIDPASWPVWDFYGSDHPIYDAWPTYGSGGLDLEAIGVLKEQNYSADIDLNGIVDVSDFELMLSAFNSRFGQPGWIARCDLAEPHDLVIDLSDVAILIEQWNGTEQWRY
jgi:hypothetical protein